MKKLLMTWISVATLALSAEMVDRAAFAREIVLSAENSGVAETIPDFVALIRLSASIRGFSYGDFRQENGADLVVADADGNVLAHEIDTWNTSGESLVWVKVPQFNATTRLYLYYGSAAERPAPVSPWADYAAVWHMGANGDSPDIVDATGNGYHGTAVSYVNTDESLAEDKKYYGKMEQFTVVDGPVGQGRKNQEGIDYYSRARNYWSVPSYDAQALGADFAFSGWIKKNSPNREFWEYVVARKYKGGEGLGWCIRQWGSNYKFIAHGDNNASYGFAFPENLHEEWAYFTFVYTGNKINVYINGEKVVENGAIDPASDNGLPLSIGGNVDGSEYSFSAQWDELRLGPSAAISAARVAADYATMSRSDFWVVGPAEAPRAKVDPDVYAKFIDIEAVDEAFPEVPIVNFPMLVRLSPDIHGFSYDDLASDGSDLVFADADGYRLEHEVNVWAPGDISLVWVKVPLFRRGSKLRCYYGGGAGGGGATMSWSDYVGVWHMDDEGSANARDASGNGLDAVKGGTHPDNQEPLPGVVGNGRYNQHGVEYYTKEKNYFEVTDFASAGVGSIFTFSGWFKRVGTNKEFYERLVSSKASYDDANGWEIEQQPSACAYNVRGSSSSAVSTPVPELSEGWSHLAFVFNGTSLTAYVNGEPVARGTIAAVAANDQPLTFGCNPTHTERAFSGMFDELRLARVARTDAEVKAEWAVAAHAAALSYGAAQTSAAEPPMLEGAVLAESRVTCRLTAGTASSVRIVYTAADGTRTLQTLAENASEGIVAPQAWDNVAPEGLAVDTVYAVSVEAVNMRGGVVVLDTGATLYTGMVRLIPGANASEDHLRAGSFTVARATDAAATGLPLAVAYTVAGGTAVAGRNYVALRGTVTIPAGAAEVAIPVQPLLDRATTTATTLQLAVASGNYTAPDGKAEIEIENLAPVRPQEFARRVDFTIQADWLNAAGEANLPVLVRLDAETIRGFNPSDVEADGTDILFVDSARNVLAHEIERWEPLGTSLVWVMVPQARHGTQIRLYYGNGRDPAATVPEARWTGYAGVWHFAEAAGTARDATGNGLDATPAGDYAARNIGLKEGAVGSARQNGGDGAYAHKSYLSVPTYDRLALGDTFTVSGFFRVTAAGGWYRLISRRNPSTAGWGQEIHSENTAQLYVYGSYTTQGVLTLPRPLTDGWMHLTFVYSGTSCTVYADGEKLDSVVIDAARDNGQPLAFGGVSDGSDWCLNGDYDEIRLAPGAATAQRARAEYRAMSDAAFLVNGGTRAAASGVIIAIK